MIDNILTFRRNETDLCTMSELILASDLNFKEDSGSYFRTISIVMTQISVNSPLIVNRIIVLGKKFGYN